MELAQQLAVIMIGGNIRETSFISDGNNLQENSSLTMLRRLSSRWSRLGYVKRRKAQLNLKIYQTSTDCSGKVGKCEGKSNC